MINIKKVLFIISLAFISVSAFCEAKFTAAFLSGKVDSFNDNAVKLINKEWKDYVILNSLTVEQGFTEIQVDESKAVIPSFEEYEKLPSSVQDIVLDFFMSLKESTWEVVNEINNAKIEGTADDISNVQNLINGGLFANFDAIKEAASKLSFEQKAMLKENNENSAILPFILNMVVGFGIGSFVQKDIRSGVTSLCFETAGLVCLIAGYANVYVNLLSSYENDYYSPTISGVGLVLLGIGYGFMVGGRIAECIAPWRYAANYNEKLEEALNVTDVKVGLVPVLTDDKKVSVALTGTIRF